MVRTTLVGSHVSETVGVSKSHAALHSTVRFVSHAMVGGVVSRTSMVWLHELVLPQASVASQVRVAVSVLPQCVLVVVLVMVRMTLVGSHASETVGVSKSHAALHSTVRFVAHTMV